MGKNLNTTKYNSSLAFADIPTNISNSAWNTLHTSANYSPAICVFNYQNANDAPTALRDTAGVLYTYFAISGSSSIVVAANENIEDNLSPDGWQVLVKSDLEKLRIYMGVGIGTQRRLRGYLYASGEFCNVSGLDDENITGFTVKAVSYRSYVGTFYSPANYINTPAFRTRTNGTGKAWMMNGVGFYENPYMNAYSIRCIKQ